MAQPESNDKKTLRDRIVLSLENAEREFSESGRQWPNQAHYLARKLRVMPEFLDCDGQVVCERIQNELSAEFDFSNWLGDDPTAFVYAFDKLEEPFVEKALSNARQIPLKPKRTIPGRYAAVISFLGHLQHLRPGMAIYAPRRFLADRFGFSVGTASAIISTARKHGLVSPPIEEARYSEGKAETFFFAIDAFDFETGKQVEDRLFPAIETRMSEGQKLRTTEIQKPKSLRNAEIQGNSENHLAQFSATHALQSEDRKQRMALLRQQTQFLREKKDV